MLSYRQIIKISNMFIDMDDPYLTPCSIYDNVDLADDLQWNYTVMNCPTSEFVMSGCDQFDFVTTYDRPISPRSLIRHHDCMWSGRCTTHPDKLHCNYMKQKQMDAQQQQQQKKTMANDTTTTSTSTPSTNVATVTTQKQQTTVNDNYIQSQQLQSIQPSLIQQKLKSDQCESIPAGRSLLIKNQTTNKMTPIIKLPNVTTNDFLKEREFIARPDTPLSLDDDPAVFKHTIDLVACTMGSNKMSLVNGIEHEAPTEIINMLKEHLEDENTNNYQMRNKLTNVFMSTSSGSNSSDSLTDLIKDIKSLSDFEGIDEDSADDIDSDSDITDNSMNSKEHTQTHYDNNNQSAMHSDHSYTRSKSRVDVIGLGVQTPSDSEEEIDVVSVGEKTLPTNPTARDRRALQTTVAHKISARIVKTTSGNVKTIPPRRRCYDDSDTSSCTTTPTKVYTAINHTLCNSASIDHHTNTTASSRKRQNQSRDTLTTPTILAATTLTPTTPTLQSSNISTASSSTHNKRFKGKKQRSSPMKRRNSESDETDTIDKRNQHNDMERQRRIGLKNLFEELKCQIPGLKDKERAPKVSILREAANLCRKFNREEEEKAALKKRQAKLYQRVSVLRTSLASKRSQFC